MSTTTTAPRGTRTTAPAEPATVVQEPVRSNTIGLIGLGLAILGFILAIFLVTAGLAWMFLIPGIVLGVIGLILPNRRRGVALAAVIVGVIGLILSFVGFRLPAGSFAGQESVVNNTGVNPFSVLAGPLPGQVVAGGPGTATGSNGDGLTVSVNSVDCHAPLASVTGLNITGEVCAVTLTATNNGQDVVSLNSSNITATADGASLLSADLGEGPLLNAQVNPGGSTTGVVYVNVPQGTTGLDGLTVSVGGDADSTVNVDLGGLRIGG